MVMNNLPAHKVKSVIKIIEDADASVVYLSPYSPDFNPIEYLWSKLRNILRSVSAKTN